MTAGISLGVYLTGFFVLFTPLPIIFVYLKRGPAVAWVTLLTALAVLSALYRYPGELVSYLPYGFLETPLGREAVIGFGVFNFLFYGWMGWVLAHEARGKRPFIKSFVLMLTVVSLLPVVALISYFKVVGLSPVETIRTGLEFVVKQVTEMQSGSPKMAEEMIFLKEQGPRIVSGVLAILPATWLGAALVTLSLNVLFVRRWFARQKPFPAWGDFALWTIPENLIWVPIAVGSLYFFNLSLGHSAVFGWGLINVLILFLLIYFYQGLSITIFFFKRKLSPWARLMAYLVVLLLLQVIVVAIVAVGLFDFWFDFRKLKRIASKPSSK